MDPFDQTISEFAAGDLEKEASQSSKSVDDPLDQSILDMAPVLPDF